MLDKLEIKKASPGISNITMIFEGNEKLNLPVLLDFAIAVYVVHEIPDKANFFKDLYDKLEPNGQLLIIEPDFIVSRRNFNKTLEIAKQIGFIENEKLNFLFSKTRILMKEKKTITNRVGCPVSIADGNSHVKIDTLVSISVSG